MGYSTDFKGRFNLDKPLTLAHFAYLRAFGATRRMLRNPTIAETLPDLIRVAVGLPIGDDGCYFVGGRGYAGQERDVSVLDPNAHPSGQPELWCKWTPTEDLAGIEWDNCEKFYGYVEWIEYLIEHFLAPWGYSLTGSVDWQGEEIGDVGTITIDRNAVTTTGDKRS